MPSQEIVGAIASMPFLSSSEAAPSHLGATNPACGAAPADDTIATARMKLTLISPHIRDGDPSS